MATIYLIRHGQASFGKENYDQLSPRGWEQGRVLGRWLAGKVTPNAVFGGNMERHRETVEAIASGYGDALPDMQAVDGFNEFDHTQVVERLRPEWQDRERMARDLAAFPKPEGRSSRCSRKPCSAGSVADTITNTPKVGKRSVNG